MLARKMNADAFYFPCEYKLYHNAQHQQFRSSSNQMMIFSIIWNCSWHYCLLIYLMCNRSKLRNIVWKRIRWCYLVNWLVPSYLRQKEENLNKFYKGKLEKLTVHCWNGLIYNDAFVPKLLSHYCNKQENIVLLTLSLIYLWLQTLDNHVIRSLYWNLNTLLNTQYVWIKSWQ